MGLLDRLGKIGGGLLDVVEAPVGLVYDLARAPWVDDEELDGGIIKVLYGRTINRGGQMFGGAFGSDRGLGAAAGVLPEPVRRPIGTLAGGVGDAMEFVYREGLAEPVTALMTAASLADAGKGFNLREGYRIAQNRSPGQAIALAFLTEDITDEAEVARAAGTDTYEVMSGLTDAAMRITADPFAVAAKAGKAAQAARWTPTARNLDRIMTSSRVEGFREAVKGLVRVEGPGQPVAGFDDIGATWRDTARTEAAKTRFAELADDDLVTVYHGTTPERAAQLRQGGRVAVPEDYVSDLPTKATDSLYVSPTRADAEQYGSEVVEIQVRKGDLAPSPEAKRVKADTDVTTALFNSFDGAILPAGYDILAGAEAARVTRSIDPGAAARIRDRFFPDLPRGDLASVVLADAAAMGDDALDDALRGLMGSQEAAARLAERSKNMANQLARLRGEEDNLRRLGEYAFDIRNGQLGMDLYGTGPRLDEISASIDELVPQQVRVQRELAAWGSLRTAPKAGLVDDLRTQITRSEVYQTSIYTKPVRMAFNMQAHRFANVQDGAQTEIQVSRMLRKSDLDIAEQDVLRSQVMAAVTPHERQTLLASVEDRVVTDMLEKAGVAREQVEQAMREISQRRGRAVKILNSRAYDGEGRSRLQLDDEGEMVDMPLLASQEDDLIPLVDLDEVREGIKWIGSFRQHHGKADAALALPGEMMQRFYQIWRPSVLLRPAWPMRVQMDEQMRIMAKLGALAPMKHLMTGVRNQLENRLKAVPKLDRIPGTGGFEYNGYKVASAFDQQGVIKEMVSARSAFGSYFAKDEAYAYRRLTKGSGQFRSITPDEVSYTPAWERAINRQIRNDPLARMALDGKSVDEMAAWLENTAEGQQHGRRLPYRHNKPRKWAQDVHDQVHAYVPEDLRGEALRRALTGDDLARSLPNAAERPIVHGEILDQALGRSSTQHYLQNTIDSSFEKLGGLTDKLARNPFFDSMYRAEVKRLLDLTPDLELDVTDIERVQDAARTYALGETKKLLYDLAEESDLAGVLRNFVPFYGAWQEVLTRWAGLAVENPAFVRRMQIVWQAPEKAGIVTDENGAVVNGDGTATSPLGERVKAGSDRFISMRLLADTPLVGDALFNDITRSMPGVKKVEQGKLNKKSFNTILTGAPGFGPVVQIPVNEIVKAKPELESSVEFILPFGVSPDLKSMIMPAAAKRLDAVASGEDDRTYSNQMMRIYFDKVVDYNLGKRDEAPTWEEAREEANSLYMLRAFTNFASPVSTTYQSPYQMHIDIYRAMKDQDQEAREAGRDIDKDADERFYEQFGEEYFALTQSLSRSMDGVPPTVEGARIRKEHQDLIEKHPELGSLIVGAEGAGEFSRAIYESQFTTQTRPGSGVTQRRQFAPEEAAAQPNIRLGWQEFGRAMDLIEQERINRGLPSLKVRAASDLAQMKRGLIQGIGAKYPEWFQEFSVVDQTKWDRRIAGFRDIVADEKMRGRPEIEGLGEYLKARDAVLRELAARKRAGGSGDITAASNMDVDNVWETIKSGLIEKNLAFGSLYNRWLENDPVAAPRLTAA